MTNSSMFQLPGVKPGSTPARAGRYALVLLLALSACGDELSRAPDTAAIQDVDPAPARILRHGADTSADTESPGAREGGANAAAPEETEGSVDAAANAVQNELTERNGVALFRGEPAHYWLERLDDDELRTDAATALGRLEPEAPHVVDRLLAAVEGEPDYPFIVAVAGAVAARGADVEQRLRDEAIGSDVARCQCAILAFRFFEDVQPESMAVLERISERNTNRVVRMVARQVFGKRYVAPLESGDELAAALSHRRAYVRNAVLTRIQAEQEEARYEEVLSARLAVEHDPLTRNVLDTLVKRARPIPAEVRMAAHEGQIARLAQMKPARYTRPDAVTLDVADNPLTLALHVARGVEGGTPEAADGGTAVARRGAFRVTVRLSGVETRTLDFSPLVAATEKGDTGLHVRVLEETDDGPGEPVEFELIPSGTQWDYSAAIRTSTFFAMVPEDRDAVAERIDRLTAEPTKREDDDAEPESLPDLAAAESVRSAARDTMIRYARENVPGRYRIECTYRSSGGESWEGTLTAATRSFVVLADESVWADVELNDE